MVTRWDVTKAVRASELPAPARLIMLTLADVAEVGTAEIPERYTPSISVLSRETGLAKSTVKAHLSSLDSEGWIARDRPSQKAQWHGERTRYRLTVPVGQETAQGGPTDGQVGQQTAHPRPGDGPGVGRETDRGRPSAGHLETDPSDQSQITTRSRPTPTSDAVAVPNRPDVEEICRHLADRIAANGSKRPTITKTWRDAARRLIDRDGRTVEQVIRAIDWCQDDQFWKSNILSMPKLREKYDQLRLQAQRGTTRPGPAASTTDQRVNDALTLAAELRAEREAAR